MDCCTRYDNPRNFDAPDNPWDVYNCNNLNRATICAYHLSLYLLIVITNHHNVLMSSDAEKWQKIGGVILLDALALLVSPFALCEAAIRLCLAIITSPFLIIACFTNCTPVAIHLLLSASASITQVASSPYIAFRMSTENGNVHAGRCSAEIACFNCNQP